MILGTFEIFSISYMPDISKSKTKSIEEGGRIMLPICIFENVSDRMGKVPLTFKIKKESKDTNVGMLEFFNDERKVIYSPSWVMKNIEAVNGDKIELDIVTLVRGEDITLCPSNDLFFTIEDKVKCLEKTLVNFPCLKNGDIIPFTHNNVIYELQITSTLPEDEIMTNECDINVNFEIKPDEPKPCYEDLMPEEEFTLFSGSGNTISGETSKKITPVKRKEYTRGSFPDYDFDKLLLKFER